MENFPLSPGSRPALTAVNLRRVLPQGVQQQQSLSPSHLASSPEKKGLCSLPSDSAKLRISGKGIMSSCSKLKAHGAGIC